MVENLRQLNFESQYQQLTMLRRALKVALAEHRATDNRYRDLRQYDGHYNDTPPQSTASSKKVANLREQIVALENELEEKFPAEFRRSELSNF
jgi:hypothetical protein